MQPVQSGRLVVRLILDTNTALSGLLWHGTPRQVIEAAIATRVVLFSSLELLAELEDVLSRAKFAVRFAQIGKTPQELITEYCGLVNVVAAPGLPVSVADDPDDDAVLACAVAAGAEMIVSGDDHLLRLGSYAGIPIATAAALLERLDSSPPR